MPEPRGGVVAYDHNDCIVRSRRNFFCESDLVTRADGFLAKKVTMNVCARILPTNKIAARACARQFHGNRTTVRACARYALEKKLPARARARLFPAKIMASRACADMLPPKILATRACADHFPTKKMAPCAHLCPCQSKNNGLGMCKIVASAKKTSKFIRSRLG